MKSILLIVIIALTSGCCTKHEYTNNAQEYPSNKKPMLGYISEKDLLKMAGLTEDEYNANKSDKFKWTSFDQK